MSGKRKEPLDIKIVAAECQGQFEMKLGFVTVNGWNANKKSISQGLIAVDIDNSQKMR